MRQRVGPSFLQAGTWARTECHGGRPYFCHTTTKVTELKSVTQQNETKQNNVTVVLLGLPVGRDGPWTEFFTGGNVGPDRVSRRTSLFLSHNNKGHRIEKCHATKRNKTKQCHGRPAWASCWSGRTLSHKSGSISNRPQFSQRV